MGKYTALDDPMVDQVVASHMQRIVTAIRTGMQPVAIILRGSFGRGEGSVLVENDGLKFLSDYEINVVTPSPLHRSLFARLANQCTSEFGVSTSINWMHPKFLYKKKVGIFYIGQAPITISLYETRYGSQILYGRDLLHTGPVIDAGQISLSSGIRLVLNRMAESVSYLPRSDMNTQAEWQSIYWINKLILACVESLLLAWGRYHYSYKERGLRFSILAKERLGFMGEEGKILSRLAEQATEFKLRPARDLYPESLQSTCFQVVSICDKVFRHLTSLEWGFTIDDDYTSFSEQYLQHEVKKLKSPTYQRVIYKLLDIYKYVRRGRLPLNLKSPNTTNQVIYSVVPLLFSGWNKSDATLAPMLDGVRHQMVKIYPIGPPASNSRDELRHLSEHMFLLWKNFCF